MFICVAFSSMILHCLSIYHSLALCVRIACYINSWLLWPLYLSGLFTLITRLLPNSPIVFWVYLSFLCFPLFEPGAVSFSSFCTWSNFIAFLFFPALSSPLLSLNTFSSLNPGFSPFFLGCFLLFTSGFPPSLYNRDAYICLTSKIYVAAFISFSFFLPILSPLYTYVLSLFL